MIKLAFGMAVLIVLSGCASAPYTYETMQGCGIAQWDENWAQNNVASMSWTGGCSDGRASGRGSHVIKLKNGKEIRYVGDMYNGRIYGSGTYIDVYGWKSEGNFDNEKLTEGKLFNSKGEIVFDGKMANDIEYQGKTITYADKRYGTGKVYVPNGSYYEGEFNGSLGQYVGGNVPQASVYARNVRDGVVVGWFVAGKKYPNESAYQVAKSQYEDRRKREIAAHQAAQAAKQAAEQRAYEQEQARKDEQNARETREALGQLIGALGQYQQNTADRKQAQQEEQQRRLQEQQAQQQEQQRRMQEQQRRAFAAEAARVDALNREAALAAEQRANQKAIAANNAPANNAPIVGTVLNPMPDSGPSPRSASGQPSLHIVHKPSPGISGTWDINSKKRAQEQQEREREQIKNAKLYEETVRKNQAEREAKQKSIEAEGRRQRQAETQARANERSKLEAKIHAAIFSPGAVVSHIDSQTCQVVFTNTTSWWITVEWYYTVTVTQSSGYAYSNPYRNAFEIPPGQTKYELVAHVTSCRNGDAWAVNGFAVTKKDNVNNYPRF